MEMVLTNLFQVLVLVGNQIDKKNRMVQYEDTLEYAKSINALYFETSAKKNIGWQFSSLHQF